MSDNKKSPHPLEDFFDIEEDSTPDLAAASNMVVYDEPSIKPEEYDSKDNEIDDQLQEIYNKAMSGYENLNSLGDVDPRFKGRLSEVALQHLNAALDAVKTKMKQKTEKEKNAIAAAKVGDGGGGTKREVIVTTHEQLMKMLADADNANGATEKDGVVDEKKIIESEVVQKDGSDRKQD